MNKWLLTLLYSLLFIITTKLISGTNHTRPFHPQNTPCTSCHMASTTITKNNASKLLATQEKLCASCHEKALKVSHPSGLTPSMKLPDIFPLDWKNEMTCSTCHNIHAITSASIRNNFSGKQLCLSCHQRSFFSTMKDGGSSIQQSVHKGAMGKLFSVVDSYSLECLNCHANEGDTKAVSINQRGIVKHSSGAINHPVGMRYRESLSKGNYKDISTMSKNVILPDGKVSCISCHKAYSKKHGAIIETKKTSSLCFECHDM